MNTNGVAAPTGAEGKFSCPMHPHVLMPKPGACPICGMALEKVPGSQIKSGGEPLAVPASAVLHSGTRNLVYIERQPGPYEGREVTVGPRAGEFYPVLKGLQDGDRVVVRGGFLIDSQAQISGQPSLFHAGDSKHATPPQHQGHQH